VAVLLDLVLPIQYPEAGSGVREGPTDIRTMVLVTIRLTGIRMSTHIRAQVMLLIPSIPTVIEDEGNQGGMPLERRRERCILGLDFGILGDGLAMECLMVIPTEHTDTHMVMDIHGLCLRKKR